MREPQPEPGAAGGPRVPWAAVAVVALAFFLADHDLGASQRDEFYGVEADALEATAGTGQWGNRIGFTVLALAGAVFLRRADRPWRRRGALPVLLILLVGWSVASLAWATDPGRTVRRLGSLTFCCAGALGFGRRLDGRELCWFVVALTAGFACLGVLVEVGLGTFRPFGAGRFAGTLHPNGQGANCAFLCLAAGTLLAAGDRHRRLLVGLFAVGLILLLAAKSRTSLGALLLGLVGVRLVRPTPAALAVGGAAVWFACVGVLAATLLGVDLVERASGSLSMGRMEETDTLSGRTDLWDLLDEYVRQRPWLGYGYGGFWTPARIEAVSGDQYWGISSAHSAYYEAALGTGRIGLTILGLVLIAGLCRAAADYWATADPGAALLLGLLLVEVIQGFAESDLALPSFAAFLLACALCRTAFFDTSPSGDAP
jgi:O-antigen ligase